MRKGPKVALLPSLMYVVYILYILRKSILVPFLCIRTQPVLFCSLIRPWSKVFLIVQYILSQNCFFCVTNFIFVLCPWSKQSMVRALEPLLFTFRRRANYEIKVLLTLFQIFHCNLKVPLLIFWKRSDQ